MQPVYIRTSPKVLLKKYALIYGLLSPLILLYFFSEPRSPILFFLILAYYIPLSLILIYELVSSYNKIMVELNSEGIHIFSRNHFSWDSIYEFRTVEKTVKTKTRRGTDFSKKHYLKINESTFSFENQYLNFTTLEIADVILLYRQKLDENRNNTENLPVLSE